MGVVTPGAVGLGSPSVGFSGAIWYSGGAARDFGGPAVRDSFGREENGVSRRTLFEGRYLRFVDSDTWEYVERLGSSGIVLILAVTDDGRILLVEQMRPAVGTSVIELPAGLAGDLVGREDEEFETAARRELLEETGYAAREFELLASGVPSAGATSERVHLYRASGLTREGPGGGDRTEEIAVHEVPVDGLLEWLEEQRRSGKEIDFKIYCGLYFIR